MSNEARDKYLAAITDRYRKAGRKYKRLILDEFCKVWGHHRKHAIRLLRNDPARVHVARGARPEYDADVIRCLAGSYLENRIYVRSKTISGIKTDPSIAQSGSISIF